MNEQLKLPIKVVTLPVKQAAGLDPEKPNLEMVLNRLWVRGYEPVHFTDLTSAIMVTLMLRPPVEDSEKARYNKQEPEDFSDNNHELKESEELSEPEIVEE